MDFANQLRALSRDDLEELLGRRAEALTLHHRPDADWADLAAVLSSPPGIQSAMTGLDRFHVQVLDLACLAGGRLTPELAEREGLPAPALEAAAAELARCGLGFPDAAGLRVPRCVVDAVPNPGAIGERASVLFNRLRVDELREIATNLGLQQRPARKEDLVAAVSERLCDLHVVRSLVQEAPDRAQLALSVLRENGGRLSWSDLAEQLPGMPVRRISWNIELLGHDTAVWWLRTRGLAVATDWDYTLAVPAEVELALRDRLFASWEPDAPPLELSPLAADRHPADLVIEVEALLELWRREPPTLLQDGDLGVRETRRAATAIGVPEGALGFLAGLSSAAGLLTVEDPPPERRSNRRRPPPPPPRRLLVPDPWLDDWRGRSVAERWLALVGPWLERVDDRPTMVIELLAELPSGHGARAEGLARRLVWQHPARFHDDEEAAHLVASIGATLHRLGMGAGGPAPGLTDLGRLAVGGAYELVARQFPALETTCTVTADLRIIVAGPPEPELAQGLARLANLEAASPARVYRLSETSLRRALDAGLSAGDIASFLRERAPAGLPQNVVALVEDVGHRHGRLRVGWAALYLQADDPALLAEVAAGRRLRDFEVRLLAPTVALIRGTDEKRLLEALRRAGYMPAVDGGAPAAALSISPPALSTSPPARTPRPREPVRRQPVQKRPASPGLDPVARRALADRLLRSSPPASPSPAAEPTDDALLAGVAAAELRQVTRLLELAAEAGEAVEIEYENEQSGRVSRRVIEPRLVTADVVIGWCRLRQAERVFALAGVRSARATGDPSVMLSIDLDASDR